VVEQVELMKRVEPMTSENAAQARADETLLPGARMTHMKGMPYQFLFFARHSESMEEFAVYECLYANPRGTLWVRPRGMFEESVTRLDGTVVPRFAQDVDAGGEPRLALGVSAAQARTLGSRLGGLASRALGSDPSRALEDAFASLAFWREAAEPLAVARGHWLVARAARVAGYFDLADSHVNACRDSLACVPDAVERKILEDDLASGPW
jgi:hypothetical protein